MDTMRSASRSQRGSLQASCFVVLCAAIFVIAQAVGAQCGKAPPKKLLDFNTATVEQLEELPEIGPTTAKAIVRFREKSGPLRRVEDLLAVRGITKRRLEKIRPLVTVTPAKRDPQAPGGKSPGTGNL